MPEAVAFQADLEELICEPAPASIFYAHYWALLMFVILVIIASTVEVDVVVVGTGRLATDTPPIVLQPIERAVIREIKVKPGDTVSKGQVLATLDPTFAQADMASLGSQQRSLLAELNRLEREVNAKPYEASGTSNPDEMLQATIYRQRQAQYKSQLAMYDQEVDRLQASIKTLDDDSDAFAKQLSLAREMERMRNSLMESQSGSKLQLMGAQSTRVQAERDYQSALNRLNETRHAVQSKQAEKQAFIDSWARQQLEELVRVRNELSRIDENLAKATRIHDFVVVVAPEDGVVLDVARRSVGSVMREAETLVTMLPSNVAMIADVNIDSGDIGYIKHGDPVVIKVDAFPYQKHDGLEGHLRSISQESGNNLVRGTQDDIANSLGQNTGKMGGVYHRAQITIEKNNLKRIPQGVGLIPGMTLSAEIKVGSRSVISYFLYPLTRGMTESMREP